LLSPLKVFRSGYSPEPIGDGDTLGDRLAATGCRVGFTDGLGIGRSVVGPEVGQAAKWHPFVISRVTVVPSEQILVSSVQTGHFKNAQSFVLISRPLNVTPSAQSIWSVGSIPSGQVVVGNAVGNCVGEGVGNGVGKSEGKGVGFCVGGGVGSCLLGHGRYAHVATSRPTMNPSGHCLTSAKLMPGGHTGDSMSLFDGL